MNDFIFSPELRNLFTPDNQDPGRSWIHTLGFSAVVLLFLLILIIFFQSPKPPIRQIVQSRIALHQAKQAGAEDYASEIFTAAERSWKNIFKEWKLQNKKNYVNRDFKQLSRLAIETKKMALQAMYQANQCRDSLRNMSSSEIASLQKKINAFKVRFHDIPMKKSLRNRYVSSELLLFESQEALKRHDYKKAVSKLNMAQSLIGQATKGISTMIDNYLDNIPVWRRWAEETITWSKENQGKALLIDKMAHICRMYDHGNLIGEYPVELGSNWIGHKQQMGDRTTPEGRYQIRKKMDTGSTKYYKALEIDYPNDRDLALFYETKENGKLPKNAQIGGSIEIHGEGGKGVDWTQGCISLKNKDMDEVFKNAAVGTPVTIVGSLNGLNHP